MIDPRQVEVETALREFLHAFEDCDLPAMDRLFAPDCVSFDQVVASSAGQAVSDLAPYRRCPGMPPAMRRTALELPTRNPGPPYHSLVPQDLMIQVFGDAAVATFHIERDGVLRRRTIVFVKRDEGWRIVHLHASSVQRDGSIKFLSSLASEDSSMSQKPVITVEDITKIALEERRPGCGKGLLHEDAPVQTAVYRVQPGSGVPTHLHARVYDLFFGVTGTLEIRYEGEHGNGVFVLKPGGFCRVPPSVRHELSNPSRTDETVFLLVQASQEGFDYVPAPFRTIEAALPFSPRS